jgi:hypothetical protein
MHPHLIADPLVGLEVQRQLGVVSLNDDLGGLLDGLCSNATHFGDCMCRCRVGGKVAVGVVSRSSLVKSQKWWEPNFECQLA